jgi:uncharacterized protein
MQLPSLKEIEALHRKYAPSDIAFQEVWQHCTIVRDIALERVASKQLEAIEKDLVAVGCMLHDIGVYLLYLPDGSPDIPHYIRHGVLGYELLKQEGFTEMLCRFASCHTGVGLTAEEIRTHNLPLPQQDFLAETDEERLVMYADKFHSKWPSQFNTVEWYKEHVKRFGDSKVADFEKMIAHYGTPDVQALAMQYNQPIR